MRLCDTYRQVYVLMHMYVWFGHVGCVLQQTEDEGAYLPVEYHSIFVCLGRCKFRLMLYLGNTSGVMRLIVH